MAREITTPLLIPYDVEERIRSLLNAEDKLSSHVKPEELLIPVYDPAHGNTSGETSVVTPPGDVVIGEGNLRWWVVTNSNMWAGQNDTLDHIFEVLWLMFGLFRTIRDAVILPWSNLLAADCAHPRAAQYMARVFRRRTLVLPDGLCLEIMTPNGTSEYEATLFRAWGVCQT